MGRTDHDDIDQADLDPVDVPELTPNERARLRALLDLIDRGARAGLTPRKSSPPKKYPLGTPEQEARIRAAVTKRMQGKE